MRRGASVRRPLWRAGRAGRARNRHDVRRAPHPRPRRNARRAGRGGGCACTAAGAAGAAQAVRTVLGPGLVDAPGGIALECGRRPLRRRHGALPGAGGAGPRRDRLRAAPAARAPRRRGRRILLGSGLHRPPDRGGRRHAGRRLHRGGDRASGSRSCGPAARGRPVTVAGTGSAGFDGDGLAGPAGELDEPTGVAVDGAGDVFIADTANCRVRVVPARGVTLFGQAMASGHLYTVAGTGVCGTAGQGGPVAAAQLWDPVAVAVDGAGDLLVADSGDQSVLLAAVQGGSHYGTAVGAGDIGVVVGGTGTLRAVSRRRALRHRPDGGAQRPSRPRRRPHRRAVRHRRLHARHPRGPGVRRDPARARHDGRRPLHRRRRPSRTERGRGRGRDPLGADEAGDAQRDRGVRRRAPSPSATAASTRCASSGRHDMSRFGRRTFLASSAGVAAGAAAAGALPGVARPAGAADAERAPGRDRACWRRRRRARCAPPGSRSTGPPTRSASTPTTARSPGRCRRRGARWSRPATASWCAGPTRRTPGSCGTAASWSRPGRPSSPTRGRRSPPTRPTSGRSGRGATP